MGNGGMEGEFSIFNEREVNAEDARIRKGTQREHLCNLSNL